MASTLFTVTLILLSLFSLSASLPSETVVDATVILSNNGFFSMALTLELIAKSLLSQTSSITIFSPSDAAFVQSGQPSLDLLQFHFLPLYLSPESLTSLAPGTKIPTMSAGRSLTVTSSRADSEISLNRVKIRTSPFFDDGSVVVFGIEKFFDMKFQSPSPIAEFQCAPLTEKNPAIETLRPNGYSPLFLESQLLGFSNAQSMMNIFAPSDDALAATRFDNFTTDYPSIMWSDLANLEDGTKLSTYSEGYFIYVTKSSSMLTLNEVSV